MSEKKSPAPSVPAANTGLDSGSIPVAGVSLTQPPGVAREVAAGDARARAELTDPPGTPGKVEVTKEVSIKGNKDKTVTVRVSGGPNPRNKAEVFGQPLFEDGKIHQPGEEFETTLERAAALGAAVEVLG